MTNAPLPLPQPPATTAQALDDDLSMYGVASAFLACHARGADRLTMITMCERLLSVTERELLERERKMMASGDPDLAMHVRRHGDVLLIMGRQVRDCRRTASAPSRTFINFVGTLVERMRPTKQEVS